MRAAAKKNVLEFRIERHDEVSSTNDIIKDRIDAGETEGLVVCAKAQNGGYGRRGNRWSSPEGGLYLSILLKPDVALEDISTLPHACAIAVRRTLAKVLDPGIADNLKIKWPNDIVYTGDVEGLDESQQSVGVDVPKRFKKICGISVEQRGGAVCVGIGVNVYRPKDDAGKTLDNLNANKGDKSNTSDVSNASPDDKKGKNVPVYLEDLVSDSEKLSIQILEEKLLESFNEVYEKWSESLLIELRDEYMRHFALEGFRARIEEGADSSVECEVVGINERGNLEVVPFGETEIKTIAAGTVRAL